MNRLYGRKTIYSDFDAVTLDNVAAVFSQAYEDHLKNRREIEYLWNYYKGKTPIEERTKKIRPEICYRIAENRANAITTFKVGYLIGKPIQYISSVSEDSVSEAVAKLNDYMRVRCKASRDKQLVEWQMICGVGYRYIQQTTEKGDKIPFYLHSLDPRNTFVICRQDFCDTPIAAVSYVTDKNGNVTAMVYTDTHVFTLKGTQTAEVVSTAPNGIGQIPIIEYPANKAKLGCFEVVLPLLDAVNEVDSNRMDSIGQLVQALLVLYNCKLDDGENANDLREAGYVELQNTNESKADIKEIVTNLDQTNVQTFKGDLISAIYEIAGVPQQSNGGNDSSNNGAMYLKQGWQGAETRAQDFEMMFKEPEQKTLEIVAKLCADLGELTFSPEDIDVKFTRRQYEDILSKSQTLVTMLGVDKIHPRCAYEASGLFLDSEEAYRMGMDWYEEQSAKAEKQMEKEVELANAKSAEDGPDKPSADGAGTEDKDK